MIGYVDAQLEIGYFSARSARRGIVARVAFDKRGITLLIPGDRGTLLRWHGERDGRGHFRLRGPHAGTKASLHRFAEGQVLEGSWRDGAEQGFWRLDLAQTATVPLHAALRQAPAAALRLAGRTIRRRRPRIAA